MLDQSTSKTWYMLLFSFPLIVTLNLYVLFNDFLFVIKASGITFSLTFIVLTLSLLYEQVTQKAIFDAQDNVGTDVVYRAAMGDELFNRYKSMIDNIPISTASLILKNDLGELMIAYETIQDLHQFKKVSEQLHEDTGFRDIIHKRLTMLEDPRFVESINHSIYHYSKVSNYEDCSPKQKKQMIEEGVQPNGYNINDPFYELKVQFSESSQFEELALKIVERAIPEDIRSELFA